MNETYVKKTQIRKIWRNFVDAASTSHMFVLYCTIRRWCLSSFHPRPLWDELTTYSPQATLLYSTLLHNRYERESVIGIFRKKFIIIGPLPPPIRIRIPNFKKKKRKKIVIYKSVAISIVKSYPKYNQLNCRRTPTLIYIYIFFPPQLTYVSWRMDRPPPPGLKPLVLVPSPPFFFPPSIIDLFIFVRSLTVKKRIN